GPDRRGRHGAHRHRGAPRDRAPRRRRASHVREGRAAPELSGRHLGRRVPRCPRRSADGRRRPQAVGDAAGKRRRARRAPRRRPALTPDKPYFHLYGETITYGRLWAVSARYAAGLARADLRAGDKLCLIYPTCAEFFYTFFGALRMGAVPVPLYPTLSVEAT